VFQNRIDNLDGSRTALADRLKAMVRSRKNPARGKRAKQGKVAALAAQPQARARAVAFGVAAALLRRNGSVNFAVAGLAAVTMALAITGAILRPDIIPFSGPALDASGNRVAASDRVQVSQVQASQALPDDGFGFDRAAIDAVSRPAAAPDASDPSVVKIVTYPNGDAVPTDPVRFPALELQANAANDGRQAQARVAPDQRAGAVSPAATSVYNGSALIAEARKYIGTNPTRRATLWCGAFLDMVLRKTGHRGGGNLALAYARYGKRIPGPKVGAIVVLRRQGGGHVGIVTGVDSNGNPIVISGNHNHRVAVATYPRSRVIAYVVPQ
jgi:uncharacterized protein (TIGR02594 family)